MINNSSRIYCRPSLGKKSKRIWPRVKCGCADVRICGVCGPKMTKTNHKPNTDPNLNPNTRHLIIALDTLQDWSQKWLLNLNIKKCQVNNNNNHHQRQCLWCYPHDHGHCESSPGSFDECRLSAWWPPTLRPSQSTWDVSPPINGCYHPHPPVVSFGDVLIHLIIILFVIVKNVFMSK